MHFQSIVHSNTWKLCLVVYSNKNLSSSNIVMTYVVFMLSKFEKSSKITKNWDKLMMMNPYRKQVQIVGRPFGLIFDHASSGKGHFSSLVVTHFVIKLFYCPGCFLSRMVGNNQLIIDFWEREKIEYSFQKHSLNQLISTYMHFAFHVIYVIWVDLL